MAGREGAEDASDRFASVWRRRDASVTVYDLTGLLLIVVALATDRVAVSSRYARGRALGAPREEDHLRKEATIKNFGIFFFDDFILHAILSLEPSF